MKYKTSNSLAVFKARQIEVAEQFPKLHTGSPTLLQTAAPWLDLFPGLRRAVPATTQRSNVQDKIARFAEEKFTSVIDKSLSRITDERTTKDVAVLKRVNDWNLAFESFIDSLEGSWALEPKTAAWLARLSRHSGASIDKKAEMFGMRRDQQTGLLVEMLPVSKKQQTVQGPKDYRKVAAAIAKLAACGIVAAVADLYTLAVYAEWWTPPFGSLGAVAAIGTSFVGFFGTLYAMEEGLNPESHIRNELRSSKVIVSKAVNLPSASKS